MTSSGPFGRVLAQSDLLEAARKPLAEGKSIALPALSTTTTAWMCRHLVNHATGPVVLVTDGPRTLDAVYQDLHSLGDGQAEDVRYFPAWEQAVGSDASGAAPDILGDRLETLLALRAGSATLVATQIQALMQRLPQVDVLDATTFTLRRGEDVDLDKLCERLQETGYQFEAEVMDRGEAARRGGIVDCWPVNAPHPVRLEFFGEEIDSIRYFDPAVQRSLEKLEEIQLPPARENGTAVSPEQAAAFTDYLPETTCWVWMEPYAVWEHAALFENTCMEQEEAEWIWPAQLCRDRIDKVANGGQWLLGPSEEKTTESFAWHLLPCPGLAAPKEEGGLGEYVEESRRTLIQNSFRDAGPNGQVVFCFNTEGARDRFREGFGELLKEHPNVHTPLGMITEGFTSPDEHLVVVAESDIFGMRKQLRTKYDAHARTKRGSAPAGARVTSWTDIEPGELVVHIDHGIGKYLGLFDIAFNGQMQEVLSIEYAEGAKIHLPVSQSHLLTRYIGIGNSTPDLHYLGGSRWTREKVVAEKAVRDYAAQMLETQAKRDALPGHAFAKDTHWQHEFEATFPYQETVDQEEAIAAVKKDLESTKPMDRLICGDVGYGKTEVAMRAAFKAVMDGKQVAMLVPTTILAQQHYLTFCERMASFPVKIEMLSRFRTPGQQKEIVKRLRRGEVDIVIGTHRITSQDVGFRDLGLVIIDEEQRFGVRHKERLKELRELVDVLTLSATPIPRTLYMGLTGARDISTIQTAPRERLPVKTEVELFDEEIIRAAILRELNREGQVFFLHNRVQTIQMLEKKLKALVPEARIAVGHGQMAERQLESVMNRFAEGAYDVLLCTTIIESGVDMPNVNTIIIDRADRFGLAELYQLRGRVGRYKHQAYAYLLLPPQGGSRMISRERIRAIQRYSELGSGFKIAMRDLEIRGAGNLLGSQQSGHITNIGFDLYCQLLEQSVQRLKRQPVRKLIDVKVRLDFVDMQPNAPDPDSACSIPITYVEDEALRVELYRRLAGLATREEVLQLEDELADRFGRIPRPVENLLLLARIRVAASSLGVKEVDIREGKLMLLRGGSYLMRRKKFPRLYQRSAVDRLQELLHVLEHWNDE